MAQMAMVKTYRLGVALKFSGIAVAGVLKTGILVSMPTLFGVPDQTREHRDFFLYATHHFLPSKVRLAKLNTDNHAVETIPLNAIDRRGL
jgi:hypothetical protein